MTDSPLSNGSPVVSDVAAHKARLRAARIVQLYSHDRLGLYGAVAAALALTAVLWGAVEHWRLLAWLVVFLAVQGGRQALAAAFHKANPTAEALPSWGHWFLVGSGLSSLLWGLTTLVVFPSNSFFHEFLLASVLLGVAAAVTVSTAVVTEGYLSSILLLAIPGVGRFLYEGGEIHFAMGVVGLLYSAALVASGRMVHSMLSGAIRLQIEKDDLIESLQQAHGDLEFRVLERTADLARKNKEFETEISYRQRAEEELRESEQRYRELAEMLPEMVCEVDRHGCLTFVNNCGCDLTGYSVEDLEMGFEAIRLIAPEDREKVQAYISEAVRGASGLKEYRAQRKDGTTFPVLARFTPIFREGEYVGVRGLMIDISERKKAGEALQESENRYRVVVEQTGQLIYDYDVPTGNIRWAGAVEQLTGFTTDEFQKVDIAGWEERIHPEDRELALAVLGEAMNTRALYDVAYRFRRNDGTYVDMEDTGAFLFDEWGVAYRMLGSMKDVTDRKRAEAALRQSEESYRRLVELAPYGVCIVREGKAVFVNRSMVKLLGGADPGEIVGRSMLDFVLPQHRKKVKQLIVQTLACSEPIPTAELQFTRLDGQVGELEITAIRFTYQNSPAVQAVCIDITERKKAYTALRESEERYRTLFEYSRDAINIVTRDGVFIDANKSFLTLFGYTTDEIMRMTAPQLWADPSMISQWQDELEREGSVIDYEWPAVRKDGAIRECLLTSTVRKFEDGKIQYQSICRDITEQKLAETALRESEQMFRLLSEQSLMAVAILQDGIYGYFNQTLASMLECSPAQIIKWRPEEFMSVVHPDDKALVLQQARLKQQGESGQIPNYTFRVCTKSGKIKWLEIFSKTVQFKGRPANLVTMLDITERKLAAEQLRQAARMEAIGQLAGGIAHDFNNLLTGILGYSDMLMQQSTGGNPSKEKLFQISRAARRAAALTQQLLAFGRKQVLEIKALDLNLVISDIEKMLRRLIGENIEIVTKLDESVGMINADPGQIEQILMNLAVNARDAMPNGGSLLMETANVTLDEQYAKANPEVIPGDYVMFAMTDSGTGMDAATRSRIFEPFFTTKRKGVGTGLGLATVYGIVKQHSGHLTAYSEPSIGTTFKIYIPRAKEVLGPTPASVTAGVRPQGTETILVVEDEEVVRNLACEAMEMLGYTPLKASDPEKALEISDTHRGPIHLLLTDVVLPQMDGRSLYDRLSISRPEMRVLYVSGYTQDFIVHHGVLDPSVHFLHKPFTVDTLGNKVRQVLDAERDSNRN